MIAHIAQSKSTLLRTLARGSLVLAAWLGASSAVPLTLLPVEAAAQAKARKLALLIGIDHYGPKYQKGVPPTEQWSSLDGTVNDVTSLRGELEKRGFEVLVLTNDQATKPGILKAFRDHLIGKSEAGRGDVLFFHYSGHGQQIPDDNGKPDEADGYDEAIVPYDNKGVSNYSQHIRDDELGLLLVEASKKTDNLVVSLDSCHSGTATRGTTKKRGGKPMHAPAKVRGDAKDGASSMVQSGEAEGAGYVLLSAVRADQEANEDTDPATNATMGAYTYLLVQALRDAGPKTTYRDLMDRIGAQIVTRVGNQNPQIEGDADKRLFSGEWAAAGKYFRVRAPQGGEVVVEAGSLHGLAVGSELAVSAPGQEGAGAVRMKVVKLELGLAWLAPVDAKADVSALAKGGQAVEVLSQVEDRGLKIAVAAHGEVVQPVLQGLGFVTVVTGRALSAALPTWDLRILDDGGQVRIERKDGSVLPIPMGKNLPMAAAVPLDDQLAGRVKQAVEGHYRRSRLLALQNTDVASRLDVELQVSHVDAVLEVGPDGKKRPKITKTHKTLTKDGNDGVQVGQIVQLHVQNKSVKPCFFTVLEISSDGSIGVLYPFKGTSGDNKLDPGQKLDIPMPFRLTPPGGSQVFKVIATEDDIDFRALEFKVRSDKATRSAGSPLERMMGMAMAGKRSEPFGYEPEKLWGTDAAVIRLKD